MCINIKVYQEKLLEIYIHKRIFQGLLFCYEFYKKKKLKEKDATNINDNKFYYEQKEIEKL